MPGFIMMVMIVVQNIVIFNVFAKYGTDGDITFFTAVNRLYILLNTPLWGLMRALQPVAGMNYGLVNTNVQFCLIAYFHLQDCASLFRFGFLSCSFRQMYYL